MSQSPTIKQIVSQILNENRHIRQNHRYRLFLIKIAGLADADGFIPKLENASEMIGMSKSKCYVFRRDLQRLGAWPFRVMRDHCRDFEVDEDHPRAREDLRRLEAARKAKREKAGGNISSEDIVRYL